MVSESDFKKRLALLVRSSGQPVNLEGVSSVPAVQHGSGLRAQVLWDRRRAPQSPVSIMGVVIAVLMRPGALDGGAQ